MEFGFKPVCGCDQLRAGSSYLDMSATRWRNGMWRLLSWPRPALRTYTLRTYGRLTAFNIWRYHVARVALQLSDVRCQRRTHLSSTQPYWFGLNWHRKSSSRVGIAKWYDGSPLTYTNFSSVPTHQCVAYSKDGFTDRPCTQKYYFTCKKRAGRSLYCVYVTISKHSGLNVLHLSKVNFLVPRMYLVKLHGTQFNYVLACINDMFM